MNRTASLLFLGVSQIMMYSCNTYKSSTSKVDSLTLLYSKANIDESNETWTFKIDSLGNVHSINRKASSLDSIDYCFTLNKRQLRETFLLADSIHNLNPFTGRELIACSDCNYVEATFYSGLQTDTRKSKGIYNSSLFNLASTLINSNTAYLNSTCPYLSKTDLKVHKLK